MEWFLCVLKSFSQPTKYILKNIKFISLQNVQLLHFHFIPMLCVCVLSNAIHVRHRYSIRFKSWLENFSILLLFSSLAKTTLSTFIYATFHKSFADFLSQFSVHFTINGSRRATKCLKWKKEKNLWQHTFILIAVFAVAAVTNWIEKTKFTEKIEIKFIMNIVKATAIWLISVRMMLMRKWRDDQTEKLGTLIVCTRIHSILFHYPVHLTIITFFLHPNHVCPTYFPIWCTQTDSSCMKIHT